MALYSGTNRTTPGFLSLAAAPISGPPLTLTAWIKDIIPQGSVNVDLVALYNSGGVQGWYLRHRALLNVPDATSRDAALSSAALSVNQQRQSKWKSVTAVFASSTSRTIWADGEASATNTASSTPIAPDSMAIGKQLTGSGTSLGMMALIAAWDVALVQAEVAALAIGVSPFSIRPGHLKVFVPGDLAHGFTDLCGRIWTPNSGIQVVSDMPLMGQRSLIRDTIRRVKVSSFNPGRTYGATRVIGGAFQ